MKFNLKQLFKGSDDNDQFFAPLWSDRSKNEWKKFLKGDYKWHDYLNPGGVIANPAQQLADPGNFFTADEHRQWFGKGDNSNKAKVSDRTLLSAAIAGMVYLGAGAPGLSSGSTPSQSGIGEVDPGFAGVGNKPQTYTTPKTNAWQDRLQSFQQNNHTNGYSQQQSEEERMRQRRKALGNAFSDNLWHSNKYSIHEPQPISYRL